VLRLTVINSGLSLTGKLPLDPQRPDIPILQLFDKPERFSNTTRCNTSKALMHFFLWKLGNDIIIHIVDPGYVKRAVSVSKDAHSHGSAAKDFAAVTGMTVEVRASTHVEAAAVKFREDGSCFLTSWSVHYTRMFESHTTTQWTQVPDTNLVRPALFICTPEGVRFVDKLWEETIVKLGLFKPQDIFAY
jgi:hypothetical protein